MDQEQFNKIMYNDFKWPEWMNLIFPAVLIFYRANKPKIRRKKIGYLPPNKKQLAKGRKFGSPKYAVSTAAQQNNFSVITAFAETPDDFGTIRRNLRHKGYGKFVSCVFATEEEIEYHKNKYRYLFYKYKSFDELYRLRPVSERQEEWKDICDRLENEYPSQASGQLRLI